MKQFIKIIKASAGSGKTYYLVLEYLLIALESKFAFTDILATTFTRKAAQQIKNRILSSLKDFTNGKINETGETIKKIKSWDTTTLISKSKDLLYDILENYACFQILTIDSFFQKFVSAFNGFDKIPTNFEVELELSNIIKTVSYSVLETSKNDKILSSYIIQHSLQNLLEGKNWQPFFFIENFCKKIFYNIFSEHEINSIDHLKNFITGKIFLYENNLKEIAQEALSNLKEINFNDFYFGQQGVMGFLFKLMQGEMKKPGTRVINASKGVEFWLVKAKQNDLNLKSAINKTLLPALKKILAIRNEQLRDYNTYLEINKLLMLCGLYDKIKAQFFLEKKKRNALTISDFPSIVYNIFENEKLDFLLKKLGMSLKYIFIDEFQDISTEQWRCFSLILKNYTNNKGNYLIGDTKQSIYRWRNSKWQLLNSGIENEFNNTETTFLSSNWRSDYNIVLFNNTLFDILIKKTCQLINDNAQTFDNKEIKEQYLLKIKDLKNIYKDIKQIPQKNAKEGYVRVEFLPEKERQLVLTKTITIVKELKSFEYQDICIIVRNHKEGKEIHDALMNENKNYTIDSVYSSTLNNSIYVNIIIATMHYLIHKDTLSLLNAHYFVLIIKNHKEPEMVFSSKEIITEKFIDKLNNLVITNISSLPLLILEIFDIDPNASQCFIEKFIDACLFFEKKRNSLIAFLDWWQEFGKNTTIDKAEDSQTIKIMTIHQSKGLEFDCVVIPFYDSSLEYHSSLSPILWCSYSYEKFFCKKVPIKYSAKLLDTHFFKNFIEEQIDYYIDNINLFYVANTRAKKNLYILAPFKENLIEDKVSKTRISQILFDSITEKNYKNLDTTDLQISLLDFFDHENMILQIGNLKKNLINKKNEYNSDIVMLEAPFKKASTFSLAYKTAEPNNEKRKTGINIHKILSRIKSIDDLDKEIIRQNQCEYIYNILMLLKHNEIINKYFSPNFNHLNEYPLFFKQNNTILKPDKIILFLTNAIILEFKTGEKNDNHIKQVENYIKVLSDIGYKTIESYILYLKPNGIQEIRVN